MNFTVLSARVFMWGTQTAKTALCSMQLWRYTVVASKGNATTCSNPKLQILSQLKHKTTLPICLNPPSKVDPRLENFLFLKYWRAGWCQFNFVMDMLNSSVTDEHPQLTGSACVAHAEWCICSQGLFLGDAFYHLKQLSKELVIGLPKNFPCLAETHFKTGWSFCLPSYIMVRILTALCVTCVSVLVVVICLQSAF